VGEVLVISGKLNVRGGRAYGNEYSSQRRDDRTQRRGGRKSVAERDERDEILTTERTEDTEKYDIGIEV